MVYYPILLMMVYGYIHWVSIRLTGITNIYNQVQPLMGYIDIKW